MSPDEYISQTRVKDAAPIFAALGDKTRLQLFLHLCSGGPMSTTRLKEKSEVTRQAIAKHLEVLSDAGLLQSSRCGHERIWKLEPKGIKKAHEYLDRLSQHWDDALDHLKSLG